MSDPLDTTLRGLTGYNLKRATSAVQASAASTLQDFGLRRVSFSALSVIVENPGLQQGRLADVLAIERSNIVHVIDGLERANLVKRARSAEDRRAYALTATLPGQRLYDQALARLQQSDAALTQGLSPTEISTFMRMLQTVEQNAQTESHDRIRKISSP